MSFYSEMAALALSKIAEYGQELTLTRTTPGTYDAVTGQYVGGSSQSQTITAIVTPASKGTIEAFDQKFIGDTLIETNLRGLKIAASGLAWAPEPNDEITYDGSTWRLIGVTSINPAGTPLLYNSSMRR